MARPLENRGTEIGSIRSRQRLSLPVYPGCLVAETRLLWLSALIISRFLTDYGQMQFLVIEDFYYLTSNIGFCYASFRNNLFAAARHDALKVRFMHKKLTTLQSLMYRFPNHFTLQPHNFRYIAPFI